MSKIGNHRVEIKWIKPAKAPIGIYEIREAEGDPHTHQGFRDDYGWWICDGQTWPTQPYAVRAILKEQDDAK